MIVPNVAEATFYGVVSGTEKTHPAQKSFSCALRLWGRAWFDRTFASCALDDQGQRLHEAVVEAAGKFYYLSILHTSPRRRRIALLLQVGTSHRASHQAPWRCRYIT